MAEQKALCSPALARPVSTLDSFLRLNQRWQGDHAAMVKLRDALADILDCEDLLAGMTRDQRERFRKLLEEVQAR